MSFDHTKYPWREDKSGTIRRYIKDGFALAFLIIGVYGLYLLLWAIFGGDV